LRHIEQWQCSGRKSGAVTDETIAVCRELWTTATRSSRHGRYQPDVRAASAAAPPGSTTMRVTSHSRSGSAAESRPAVRRAAKLGDAWYPIGTNPRNRLDTLKRFEGGIDRLRKMAQDAGRDPKDVALAYRFSQFGRSIPEKADNGDRRLGSGDAAAIAADLRSLRDLGVIAVDFGFSGVTADTVVADMCQFRETVLAKV
jgi:alkanesulfonate monooxygenase SsuD/methylene tetrahydromethanopterin reductase-like flavin-dependent oxidoreductase (luciferase family)